MFIHSLTSRYDISNDGTIDQKELTNLIVATVIIYLIQLLSMRRVFVQYDLVGETDRKGDKDPKKRAADIIAELDTAGDKKITRAEFIAG